MDDRLFRRIKPLPGEEGYGCYFIGALIGGAASLIGGAMGADAAEEAGDQQAAGEEQRLALEREMYETQREDVAPYREAGQTALNRLQYLSGTGGTRGQPGDVQDDLLREFSADDFEASPGYQFRLGEGEKAINRAAAARGMFSNPATVKELSRHGQGMASSEYGDAFNRFRAGQSDRFNRLAALSGLGQTATGQLQSAAQRYAAGGGGAMSGIGGAQAAGTMGAGNAWAQGLTGAASTGLEQYQVNRLMAQQPQAPTAAAPYMPTGPAGYAPRNVPAYGGVNVMGYGAR